MAKRIRLLNANFRSASIKLGSEALTTVHFSAPFEQLVAEQLGVKDRVYKKKADEDEPDMRGYDVGIEWYGPQLIIRPKQGTLDGKVKLEGKGSEFRVLKLSGVTIKRHKDDEQMLVSFQVILQDTAAEMHQLIHAIKKDCVDLDIVPPSAKAAAEASTQLRLINSPKEEDLPEDAEESK